MNRLLVTLTVSLVLSSLFFQGSGRVWADNVHPTPPLSDYPKGASVETRWQIDNTLYDEMTGSLASNNGTAPLFHESPSTLLGRLGGYGQFGEWDNGQNRQIIWAVYANGYDKSQDANGAFDDYGKAIGDPQIGWNQPWQAQGFRLPAGATQGSEWTMSPHGAGIWAEAFVVWNGTIEVEGLATWTSRNVATLAKRSLARQVADAILTQPLQAQP